MPLIRITDIKADELDESDIYHITPHLNAEFSRSILEGNEVLLSIQGTIGRVAICPRHFKGANISRTIAQIAPDSRLDRSFLRYWLLSMGGEFPICGATRASLNIGALRELRAPVPPLPEQQRIVGILDEAFEGIATVKANAEKNLKNARALFECHLQSVFGAECEGWVQRRLADLSRINYGYTQSSSSEKVGPKFLRITDIQNDRVDWESVPYCPIDPGDFPRYQLSDGDIVFVRTGATTGKSFLVTDPPEAVFASYLIRVQVNVNEVLPEFVDLFFKTSSYWDTVRSGVSGSAQGGFNATKLGELTISYPKSRSDQYSVVQKADAVVRETQALTLLYRRKLDALDELKKSLLHQAFAGPLGAQAT